MASPERDEFGNMVDAGDTKYWNDDFAGGFANQYPVQRLQSGTPGSMSLGVQTMDPGQNLPLPPARGPAGFDNRGPAGFDNDGFFGDPRRMAQELNFDPATGEYTPFGYNGGPLASGIFGATPTPPDMSLLSEQRTPLSDMGYDPETTARLAAMLDPNSTTRPAPPIPGMAPRDGDPRRMSLLSPTTGVNGGTILNPVAVDPVRDGTVSLDNGFEQETTISPGQPIPGMIPRVGAFEPLPIPGGQRSFSYPNVERDASVPSWMVNNPDFDPMGASQSGMQEYTNPATGETYMGGTSSNNQYMVDPSLEGEFTTPNRGGSLMGSNGSEFSGIFGASPTPTPSPDIGLPTLAPVSSTPAPSASQPTPYTQDFDSMHREQHSQMGGGITSVAPSDNFTRPTWSGSPGPMSMGNPFSFQQPGYQTGSPFGSMPSQFGGGLPRGYYT